MNQNKIDLVMEDFVPFELNEKLKEKGFNVNALPNYLYCNGELCKVNNHCNLYPYEYAPTISQVLKWLREEKKIYLEFIIVVDTEYTCDIYKFDVKPIECIGSTDYFKTYELAALAGIEYVIDNLI